MSSRPLIALAVCVPFVIGAAMRGGSDDTAAAPKPAAPAPLAVSPAPRVHVPHSGGDFPDLAPKPTPKPKPKPKATPTPPVVHPTPIPSRPQPTPTPTQPKQVPRGPIMCIKAPCPQGGGED